MKNKLVLGSALSILLVSNTWLDQSASTTMILVIMKLS